MTVSHPAKFSAAVLEAIRSQLPAGARLLDPFAGVGGIHTLHGHQDCRTVGVELEPEWAAQHPQTIVGDALHLPFADATFDVIATSPVYGNRMSDHHDAKDDSRRITYRHSLGRPLSPTNAGKMQWGDTYRLFHTAAWREARRVLRPGGLLILNVSDHIRAGRTIPVARWHRDTLEALGFDETSRIPIDTPRMRFGANHDARADHEALIVFASARTPTLDLFDHLRTGHQIDDVAVGTAL